MYSPCGRDKDQNARSIETARAHASVAALGWLMDEMARRRDVMHMSAVEKLFVNREAKGRHNFKRVRQILAALPTDTMHCVLELGCGIGTLSALLAACYPMDVVGTDSDPAQIEIARVRHPETDRLHYRVEDASKLSCTDFFLTW
jgi:2-polyprenyl-3-methyl-5-hydroxy-6-metoxy-1,4-benzoquinol methylase